MKSLKQIKEELKEGIVMGLHQTQRDTAIRSAYSDMTPGERKELDSWCMEKYGRRFMDCSYDEQGAARSIISADDKEIEKQNKKDALKEAEEDPTADVLGDEGGDSGEGDKKDKKEEVKTPDEQEEEKERKFVDMLQDQDFISAFTNEMKKYVSKHLLNDDYNSFAVIPFVEFLFKENQYGLSIEFESAVTFNIDDKGNVYEKDIPKVSHIKYTTPEIDELVDLEDEIGATFVDSMTRDALDEIKKVSR